MSEYRTHAIISHGSYTFYPIFNCGLYCRAVSITDNLCTKQVNSSIFEPKIRGFKSRVGYNGARTVVCMSLILQISTTCHFKSAILKRLWNLQPPNWHLLPLIHDTEGNTFNMVYPWKLPCSSRLPLIGGIQKFIWFFHY